MFRQLIRSIREKGGSLIKFCLPERLVDPITAFLLDEESPQPFGREILRETPGIQALAGLVQQLIVEVSGEDLESAQDYAPVDASLDGAGSVERKVNAAMVAKEQQDFSVAAFSNCAAFRFFSFASREFCPCRGSAVTARRQGRVIR